MYISLLFHSIFYIVNLSSYLILLKYVQITYQYDNFWFTTLLSICGAPFYFIYFTKTNFRSRLKNYGKQMLFPIFAGVLYSIESIMLFYSINNISLSYYTVLRSSFVIWNIPFFIFLLKKKVGKLYLIGCICLLICYSMIVYHYLKSNLELWKPTSSVILSCFFNSVSNVIIEYSIKKFNILNIDFQIIFQLAYFFSAIIPSLIKTIENPPPVSLFVVILSAFIAISVQFFFYNKVKILENKNDYVPSNVLMSGLDLLRRIILLIFSFAVFKDDLNGIILGSLFFFIASGICMFVEYLMPPPTPISTKYTEMDEIVV